MPDNKTKYIERTMALFYQHGHNDHEKMKQIAGRMWELIQAGDPDVPPPPPIGKPPHPLLQFDGMGIFLWFQLGYWDEDTRTKRIEEALETLAFFANLGYSAVNYFAWLYTGTWDNQHFNHLCPYPRNAQGLFELGPVKDKWMRSLEDWHNVLTAVGIKGLCCDFMARYCWKPFAAGNNANGVKGFFDPEALQYQIGLGNAINVVALEDQRRMMNEPKHLDILPGADYSQGPKDDVGLHTIHDWLRDYYEGCLKEFGQVQDILLDVSGSEADPFVEGHACPKCGDKILGDRKYLDENGKRQHNRVVHGVSLVEDIPGSGYHHWLGGDWHYPKHVHWWGGDGGTKDFKHKARGYKLRRPNGGVLWAQGDAEQTYDVVRSVLDQAKRANNYRAGYQLTCFESLKGWPFIENFRLDQLDKERIEAGSLAAFDVFPEGVIR